MGSLQIAGNEVRPGKYPPWGPTNTCKKSIARSRAMCSVSLLRLRCWQLRHLNVLTRTPKPTRPEKARRMGYKAKQGYVVYRIRIRRGGRKRPVAKGCTYGKPKSQGVNHLK